jgi:tRNA/tmRNA/rRNA uracil-C5-methylase (TrmA/RlmC/RlmD family)
VEHVAATGAARLVLVSCDPAALGRDAALLATAGYDLVTAQLVDLFPHTSHVEVVSRFDRR